MLIEEVDAVTTTLNTAGNDFRCAISRNGGTGWDYVTLVNKGSWGTNKKILVANNVAFSNSASGTDMRYKIEWANQTASVSAGTAKILTAVGGVQHSTTQEKFGATSIKFDGSGDWITTPAHTEFNFSGDFTIECWLYWDGTSGEILNFDAGGGGGSRDLRLFFEGVKLKWVSQDIGGNGFLESSNTIPTNTWTHIAVVRSGNTLTGYNEGVVMNTPITVSGSLSGTSTVHIGGPGDNHYAGYMDEIRLSNSARYTSAFNGSVPNAIFTADANTILLIHSDSTNTNTTFVDTPVAAIAGRQVRVHATSLAWA
jgi:hypothetical protein